MFFLLTESFFVLSKLVQYQAKRFAGKNIFEIAILCRVGSKTLLNQSAMAMLWMRNWHEGQSPSATLVFSHCWVHGRDGILPIKFCATYNGTK